jgi:hypothetical protein
LTNYSVKRSIAASPEAIWELLTDAGSYPRWNPAVLGIEGEIAEGERIKLTSIVNPDREFKLNVSDVDAPRSMVWSDGMPLGLFKGVRTFRLTPEANGSTEFFMEEVYSGLMAPLITKSIPDMTESFEIYGDSLKAEAEKRGS